MHYRLIVTIDKKHAKTSKEARTHVFNELHADHSFCGEGGRFDSPVADWFVIGGRWSGELSDNTWAKGVIKKIATLEKERDIQVAGVHYGDDRKKAKQAEVKDMVEAMYKGALPAKYKKAGLCWDRDTYNELGYEDDAMIVDKELYKTFLKEWEGEDIGNELEVCYVDLDYDCVDKDMIGKKWIVVVDYHS